MPEYGPQMAHRALGTSRAIKYPQEREKGRHGLKMSRKRARNKFRENLLKKLSIIKIQKGGGGVG